MSGNNILNKLELPDFIIGLPFSSEPHIFEAHRIFEVIHRQVAFSRYSLHLSYIDDYSLSKDNADLRVWHRCLHLNNAIMWYNTCFDLLLQTIWLYDKLYMKHFTDGLTTNTLEGILKKCKIKLIQQILGDTEIIIQINTFKDNNTKVTDLTNSLKHRNGIEYTQLPSYLNSNFSLSNDLNLTQNSDGVLKFVKNESIHTYNSMKTNKREGMTDIQDLLIKYHTDYLILLKEVCLYLKITK